MKRCAGPPPRCSWPRRPPCRTISANTGPTKSNTASNACKERPAMESISKTRVSPETMQEIAARHLGQPLRSASELREGWFNAAFVLELDGGQKYVLKVAPPPDVKV